jgi:acyl-CoA synthetase (NDP forming)
MVPDWRSDLRPLFRARSVAIIGASERQHIASGTLKSLRSLEFPGPIYPVNPKYESVDGLTCYPTLRAVPGPVDLAIVILNAQLVPGVMEECAALGVGAVTIMSTGFAEAGGEGAATAKRIGEIAHANQIRLCGPGSFGTISVHDRVSAFMAPFRSGIRPGSVSVLTQSGSLVNAIIALGHERRLGFSFLASAGSEAGLMATDYLSFYLEDEATKVIGAIVEQFRDPAAFVRVAERAAELGKPLIVLKLGRSEAAQRATLAHTGALAGSPEFHDALFRRYGVSAVNNLDEFMEALSLFTQSRLPRGDRVGILSVSGGDGVLASDVAARLGITLAPLTEETQAKVRALIPEAGLTANPVDIGMRPLWESGLFGKALDILASDPNVDLLAARFNPDIRLFAEMEAVVQGHDIPVVTFTRATQALSPEAYDISERIGVPIVQEVEKGLTAINHLLKYAESRRRRDAGRPSARLSAPAPEMVREARAGGRTVLTEADSKRVLAAYGFPVTRETLVGSADEAVRAADRIGYPVALKLMSPEILHKTEAGALAVGLRSETDVRTGYGRIVAAGLRVPGAHVDGVLVQEMAPSGIELMLGVTRDADYGLGIVFGLGGTYVEVLKDSSLRIPPLDRAEALAMIAETKAGQILGGVRGRKASDLNGLADLLVRLSELCGDFGDGLEAIDINPLTAYEAERGMLVVDASILLRR